MQAVASKQTSSLRLDMPGLVVESSTTGAPRVSSVDHVNECASTWSVVGFVLTSSHTAIGVVFALNKGDVYSEFYIWVMKPICVTAMVISFAVKPRRTDFAYMTFLYFQYAVLTLGSEVSERDVHSSSSYRL